MAQNEKKGGFFSRFRQGSSSGNDESAPATPKSSTVQAQDRIVTSKPESMSPVASAAPTKAPVVQKPVAASASQESVVDTVEAFNRYCGALIDIGTSQLKVAEMALGMLSNSINKILDGSKTKQ